MTNTLVVIDVQKAIDHPKWGVRNNPDAELNIARLLTYWRSKSWSVVHIQHNSTEENSPYKTGQALHDFKSEVAPRDGEPIVGKTTNNAFIETRLAEELNKASTKKLIVSGVLTQHSVDCTARMAASLGYEVIVVSDGTAATEVKDQTGKVHSADDVHNLTLAHLAADYATIKTTEELLLEGA